MIKSDLDRVLFSRNSIITVVFLTLYIYLIRISDIVGLINSSSKLEEDFCVDLLTHSLSDEKILFIIPIAAAFPYAASFVEEYRSGCIRFLMVRTTLSRYLVSKLYSVYLSGAKLFFEALLLARIIGYIFFLPIKEIRIEMMFDRDGIFLKYIALYILLGGLYAVIGLMFAAMYLNNYMAWIGGFVLEYMLIIVSNRFYRDLDIINPVKWICISTWQSDGLILYLWLINLTLAVLIICYVKLRGRLRDV